ncbi:hypothetical protein CVT25_013018 [Psilocybe cyanescens]|uniref:Uncharacterized protein n=1 Tax=Psilocybe cyanescens TaxID=93625 RepID=A0A409XM10_PSICY|nr:hypothetical protein CVT25_013018 [Psilocybe cyanescens]
MALVAVLFRLHTLLKLPRMPERLPSSRPQTIARKPNILTKPKERQVCNPALRLEIPPPGLACGGYLERDNLPAEPAPVRGSGVIEGRGDIVPGVAAPAVARHKGLEAVGPGNVSDVETRSGVGLFVWYSV